MSNYKFEIIYGCYEGVEKKAVDMVSRTVSDCINYSLTAKKMSQITEDDLKGKNIVIVGTVESNSLLKKLAEDKIYTPSDKAEGYTIKVLKSIFDENAQMIIICGHDERGVLYGAADFAAYYIPFAEQTHNHGHYLRAIFTNEELPEYEKTSSPSIKNRGIWSWGHVIYDYKRFIKNMAALKMNTLIIWNDFVPINIKDIIKEAKEYGIYIYLGYSWGWNEARKENGGIDISDDAVLNKIGQGIIKQYKEKYSELDIDGIYFQSFTETNDESNNNIVIAERVVKMVNDIAEELFGIKPELDLIFGLHATSVSNKLEYIKQTDERIMIMWEDCGAFPYAYTPNKVDDFDEMIDFTEKVATLRGENERFGVVTKGLICLDWTTFEHQTGEFVMGEQSDSFIEKRQEQKSKIWRYVNGYWLKNADYAYNAVKKMKEVNENTVITALIEDGMFESQIYLAAAAYAEMMWDTQNTVEEILHKVSLRKDVEI